ncbi:hypothetical protein [Brevibacterium aurantiacum]|uniref:hypothetical protein n=1 Tax=Brevibacterium aurantiacum TaxID=273384 RepID=UPI001867E783|nr:hypothetical protein [Brevibacterium aurantiacum]
MSSETTKTQELIWHLKNPTTKQKPLIRKGVDKVVFFTAGVLAVGFVVWGFLSPDSLGAVAGTLLTGVMDNFG